jgi:hypothetical protein
LLPNPVEVQLSQLRNGAFDASTAAAGQLALLLERVAGVAERDEVYSAALSADLMPVRLTDAEVVELLQQLTAMVVQREPVHPVQSSIVWAIGKARRDRRSLGILLRLAESESCLGPESQYQLVVALDASLPGPNKPESAPWREPLRKADPRPMMRNFLEASSDDARRKLVERVLSKVDRYFMAH